MEINYLIFYLQRDVIGSPYWCARWDSNPHELFTPRILSPVRLPVPPFAHLYSRVFLLPRDSLCNGHLRSYLYSMREEFIGAQRRSRTFKHWFLRPAALPVCIFVHIRSGATIVLNDTNPARKRVCTN